jgi:hypothetical protein
MNLECVCVPCETLRRMSSARRIVRMYERGVRDIVDRKRCPPG